MTIVALIRIGEDLAIIADTLLSSRTQRVAYLPTYSGPLTAGGDGYFPSGSSQKLIFVNEDLLLGWAGAEFRVRPFLTHLRATIGSSAPSASQVHEAIGSYPSEDLKGLSFVLVGSNDRESYAITDSAPYSCSQIDDYLLIGSGTQDFFRLADEAKEFSPSDDATRPAVVFALQLAIASLYSKDILSAGIERNWGGVLEIVTPVGGKLTKLDRVLYLCVHYDSDGDRISMAFPWFYTSYRDGVLQAAALHSERAPLDVHFIAEPGVEVAPTGLAWDGRPLIIVMVVVDDAGMPITSGISEWDGTGKLGPIAMVGQRRDNRRFEVVTTSRFEDAIRSFLIPV